MIEISDKKLKSLLEDLEKEVAKTQEDFNRICKAKQNCKEELMAKKNLMFSITRILELKNN